MSSLCFAYWRRRQRSTDTNIIAAIRLLFQNSPILWAVLAGNGNMFTSRWGNIYYLYLQKSKNVAPTFMLQNSHLLFKITHFRYLLSNEIKHGSKVGTSRQISSKGYCDEIRSIFNSGFICKRHKMILKSSAVQSQGHTYK